MEKSVVFRITGSSIDYVVGQTINFRNGTKGKITSIRSVKNLHDGWLEVIGRYKPIK